MEVPPDEGWMLLRRFLDNKTPLRCNLRVGPCVGVGIGLIVQASNGIVRFSSPDFHLFIDVERQSVRFAFGEPGDDQNEGTIEVLILIFRPSIEGSTSDSISFAEL